MKKSLRPLKLPKKAKIALVYRKATESAVAIANELTDFLLKKNHQVFTGPEQKALKKAPLLKSREQMKDCDFVIVLGGDGTYLRAVQLLNQAPVPILGINMGSLGFLTPVRAEEVFEVVNDTLAGKMFLSPRTMLNIKVGTTKSIWALNDAVVERGRLSQLIKVRLSCGDDFVSEIKADGLIISSPTGSTAYNLAAGGPLLHPSVKGFSVTPIAPHSLTSRPFVVPDDEELKLQVNIPSGPGKSREAIPTAQLIVDGQLATDLKDGDELTISLNSSVHWMIQDPDRSFFILLREKLKFGDRA